MSIKKVSKESIVPNKLEDGLLEGEIEISVDGVVKKYQAGDFAYLYAGSRQTFTIRNRVKHIYITYPRDWLSE